VTKIGTPLALPFGLADIFVMQTWMARWSSTGGMLAVEHIFGDSAVVLLGQENEYAMDPCMLEYLHVRYCVLPCDAQHPSGSGGGSCLA